MISSQGEQVLEYDGGTNSQTEGDNTRTEANRQNGLENDGLSNDTPITAPGEVVADNADTQGGGKLKSDVWRHFKRDLKNGIWYATCPDCKKELKAGSNNGTTHLRNHMKSCMYKKQRNVEQCLLQPTKNKDGIVRLGNWKFDPDTSREELAKMIVMHEYPLSIVDHRQFRRFVHSLNPNFTIVCRNTIKSDILKIFEYEKSRCMRLLDTNSSRVTLTTDMWTSNNQKRGFMAITSHFIDDSWKLQSRLLRFIYVPKLAQELIACMYDWNLDRKLSTLTLDNCSTNDVIVDAVLGQISSTSMMLDGKFFHMRCSAHILNLVVKDGLEVIKSSIETIRSSVQFWTASAKREEKFEETIRQLKILHTKKLQLDCPTRWNSIYNMLDVALLYKNVFPRLKQREPLYKKVPTEDDWAKTKEIAGKLKMFYDATVLFSGTKYLTANLFFKTVCQIKLAIDEWIFSEHPDVAAMAARMLPKFDKYWSTMHGLLGIASILDPRYKLKTMQYYFPKIYPCDYKNQIDKIKQLLYDLVEEYEKRSVEDNFDLIGSSRPAKKAHHEDDFEAFMDEAIPTKQARSDLDYYLEESLLPRTDDFDILTWWRSNGIKYRHLHDIARDILAIPISTVASESSFSTSGRIISPHRSRLHSKTVEALMCARDWLWSMARDDEDGQIDDFEAFDGPGSTITVESDANDNDIAAPENISLYQ